MVAHKMGIFSHYLTEMKWGSDVESFFAKSKVFKMYITLRQLSLKNVKFSESDQFLELS
jgi:hypothetical protein